MPCQSGRGEPLMHAQLRDHRLAADHGLADGDQRANALGQIEVGPAAEADDAEALAGVDRVALAQVADDAPGDQAGDLHHGDLPAVRQAQRDGVALVRFAGLVQAGVEEAAVAVGDSGDDAVGRDAVHVDVQHGQEGR